MTDKDGELYWNGVKLTTDMTAPSEPGRRYVHPVMCDERGYRTELTLMIPEGFEATKVKAMTPGGQFIASMDWNQNKAECSSFTLELVKHNARHATLYITSRQPESWSAQVEYRECAKAAEYYAKLTATCTVLRQRAAAAAAVPVGGYSAPGEPLRVSLSELTKDAGKPPVRLDGGRWLYSRPGEKHGPNETGAPGPCDADCRKCQAEQAALRAASPPDPMDQVIDEFMLRTLLEIDELASRHDESIALASRELWTPAQRAAVSAHWSAQLRLRVEAKRKDDEAAATSVRYCEVEPWE